MASTGARTSADILRLARIQHDHAMTRNQVRTVACRVCLLAAIGCQTRSRDHDDYDDQPPPVAAAPRTAQPPAQAGQPHEPERVAPAGQEREPREQIQSATGQVVDELSPQLAPLEAQLEPRLKQAELLMDEGRTAQADAMLLSSVPRGQWTAAHYLLFGNKFFRGVPDLSEEFHKEALRMAPNDASANLAWAMDLHRTGKCSDAILPYERGLSNGARPEINALLAECYLREGKLEQAAQTWLKVEYRDTDAKKLSALHELIRSVHGPPSPLRRRAVLLERIAQGETALAAELIQLDLQRDGNPWGTPPLQRLMQGDLERLSRAPGMQAEHLSELRMFADLKRSALDGFVDKVESDSRRAGLLLGPGSRLPRDSSVALELCKLLLLATPGLRPALLAHLGPALRQRVRSKDLDATRLLILLNAVPARDDYQVVRTGFEYEPSNSLRGLLQDAWTQTGDSRFAHQYLLLELTAKRLHSDSPALVRARKQFSHDANVAAIALRVATDEHRMNSELVAHAVMCAIEALSGDGGTPGVSAINSDFARLYKLVFESEAEVDRMPTSNILGVTTFDNQVLALVETFITYRLIDNAHARRYRDVYGFLARVDLTKPWTSDDSRQLFGPLWSMPGQHETFDRKTGRVLTDSDKKGDPMLGLRPGLGLVRETRLTDGSIQRHKLALEPGRAKWIDIGTRVRMPDALSRREDTPVTPSGRYVLHEGVLFDTTGGRRNSDPWLSAVTNDLRRRSAENLDNCYLMLSDDLNYLVAIPSLSPYPIQYDFDPNVVVDYAPMNRESDDFAIGDKRYQRSTSGLVYKRPVLEPAAFPRAPGVSSGTVNERALLVIDKEPLLLLQTESELQLMDLKATLRRNVASREPLIRALALAGVDAGRVVFVGVDQKSAPHCDLIVRFWDLKQNKLVEQRFQHDRFFKLGEKGFEPIAAIPVEP